MNGEIELGKSTLVAPHDICIYIYIEREREWKREGYVVISVAYACYNITIGQVGREFAIGLAEWPSIPDQVISNTKKMVQDTSLFYTPHYKVRIKG